jgi:crotonobetaine/carnitine-CoA ligase
VAAAVRAESELGEHEVLAVVSVADATSFDPAGLWQFCVDHMPRFMVPRYVRVVDSLPFTPTGKVRKADLRDEGLAAGTWDAEAEGYRVPKP